MLKVLAVFLMQLMLSLVYPRVQFYGQSNSTYILKVLKLIADSHCLCVHSYADDMQCFFFDRHSSLDTIKNNIRTFLQDLKQWMSCNFLKNE